VGIVWAGNPEHPNDLHRSAKLSDLEPLFSAGQIAFYSLQQRTAAEEREQLGARKMSDVVAGCTDFLDTAHVIRQLDLVIAVDTSVAHLAGALGKPTWLLLPFAPDWRWFLNRVDSPWYPSMRLFRQPAPGAWAALVTQVKNELSNAVRAKNS
jgi:ADP-heptose:LPS heptosyltransferase